MILDRNRVRRAIANRLSYNQSADEQIPTLSPVLTNPEAAFNINSVHPLLTLENIDAAISYFDRYNYPTHILASAYEYGEVVIDSGIVYQALDAVPSSTPITDTAYWFLMDEFNQHLHTTLLNGADRAINTVMNGKKVRTKTKAALQNTPLFDGFAHKSDKTVNSDDFVGFRIMPIESQSLAIQVKKLSLQLSAPCDVTLYTYHTSQIDPISETVLSYTKSNAVQWFDVDFKFVSSSIDEGIAGGEYYMGYKQSELEGQGVTALRMKELDWSTGHGGCVSCGNRSRVYYQNYTPFVGITSFSVGESEIDSDEMFDPRKAAIGSDEAYGMNFWLSAKCDMTSFVANDPYTFAESAANVVALELLKSMASSVRGENQLSNAVATQADKEIVSVEGVLGTVLDITKASLEALSFDLSSLDPVCLQCDEGDAELILGTRTMY